ncbi:MAG: response regulator [Evtepia gabavorous]
MERIYLLEDDDSIRKLSHLRPGQPRHEAQGFDRPSDFWSAMEGPQPALILLDIMLPEEDGLSILQKLPGLGGHQAHSCDHAHREEHGV